MIHVLHFDTEDTNLILLSIKHVGGIAIIVIMQIR